MSGPTVTLKQRACPACAAPMPAVPRDADHVRCQYCGQSFEVVGRPQRGRPRARAAAAPSPAHTPQDNPSPRQAKPKKGGNLFGCFVTTIVLVALGGAMLVLAVPAAVGLVATLDPATGRALGEVLGTVEPSPPPGSATQGLRWRTGSGFIEGAPALIDLDGDGSAELVGFYTSLDGAEPVTWVGAFEVPSLARRWRSGPLTGDGPFGLVGVEDRLVVLESFGVVSILEAATGTRVGQLQLPDNPGRPELCRFKPPSSQVLVGSSFVVDAATGLGRAHRVAMYDLPAACTAGRPAANTTMLGTGRSGRTPGQGKRFAAEGYRVQLALVDGDHGIALADSARGRPETVLIGFDPSSRAERWRVSASAALPGAPAKRPIVNVDLGLGVVVVVYTPDGEASDGMLGHLPPGIAAFDAKTGERRWARAAGEGLATGFTMTFADGRVWLAEPQGSRSRLFGVDLATADTIVFGAD